MDGECHILGRVARRGSEGVPRRTVLGILLALALLVVVLAAALVVNYRRRKQLGELSTPILAGPPSPSSGASKSLYPLLPRPRGRPTPSG